MKRIFMVAAAFAAVFAADVTGGLSAQQALSFETSGDPAFDAWRADFAQRAVAAGRSSEVVGRLLKDIRPDPMVIQQDRNQAEFTRPVWDYIDRMASMQRIAVGSTHRAQHAQLFADVERRYGVDADIITAIWGVETNFGGVALPNSAVRSIATLAAEGRRRQQFEAYLLALIEMVERGFAGPDELKSSWAGALGQPQFMPDIYLSTSVDWDNDGKRDIWTSKGDIFASIANYLAARGWRRGEPVYDEVRLPQAFNYGLADGRTMPVSAWVGLGAVSTSGFAYPEAVGQMQASLFLPAGAKGPALLLFPNFSVIKTYNNSDRYALAVSLLARGLEGGALLVQPWPVGEGSLNREQILALQQTLNTMGFDAGQPDGMFGSGTRAAVRRYQIARNLPADGWPTPGLLSRVTGEAAAAEKLRVHAASPSLPDRQVAAFQRALIKIGLLRGAADGEIGADTRRAIQAFERRLGLPETGRASTYLFEEAEDAARRVPAQKSKKRRR